MLPDDSISSTSAGTESPQIPVADEEVPPPRKEIHIPAVTFIKIFVALLCAYALFRLWPLLLLVFLALFLAVTLDAFVDWLMSHKMKRWLSLSVVIGTMITIIGVGLALIVPVLIEQAGVIAEAYPKLRETTLENIPVNASIRGMIRNLLESPGWSEAGAWLDQLKTAGSMALGGIFKIALLLVIAIYLLIDGKKTYDWALAFFSPLHRRKIHSTSEEISRVIFGYVSGQFITSALVTIYTFIVLSALHVPVALTLAILAGVLDVLPLLGFILSTAPAVLLALSVSPQTAFLVLALYVLFHLLECYLIVPWVYGKQLRLSTLTVLLGLLAGSLLAGIPGALAALPIMASYEAIERIWLQPYLREGVSEKHEIQKEQVFGEQT